MTLSQWMTGDDSAALADDLDVGMSVHSRRRTGVTRYALVHLPNS